VAFGALAGTARADIFQWEYINPVDPSQGKRQSTTLAPDGAGVDVVPGADLSGRNLTMAHLFGASLQYRWNGRYVTSDLTATNLTQADLTNARLDGATLTGADLTGAHVRGASFLMVPPASPDCWLGRFCSPGLGTGITPAQLYSTASYRDLDLTGIGLVNNDLKGTNFAAQNLTNSQFSYANLTNADFLGATLSGASFSGAVVRGANFDIGGSCFIECGPTGSGIALAQLYSMASLWRVIRPAT
jgi:hypothetical protein